jgi:hypothetical protein
MDREHMPSRHLVDRRDRVAGVMSKNTLVAVAMVATISWLAFLWGGTAYLVGWHDWSPWWFIVTLLVSEETKVTLKA